MVIIFYNFVRRDATHVSVVLCDYPRICEKINLENTNDLKPFATKILTRYSIAR